MKKLMQLPSSLVQDVPYNLVSDEMPVAPYLAPIVSLFTQSHTAVLSFSVSFASGCIRLYSAGAACLLI